MDVRLQKLAAAVPTLLVDIVDDMIMRLRGNSRCALQHKQLHHNTATVLPHRPCISPPPTPLTHLLVMNVTAATAAQHTQQAQ